MAALDTMDSAFLPAACPKVTEALERLALDTLGEVASNKDLLHDKQAFLKRMKALTEEVLTGTPAASAVSPAPPPAPPAATVVPPVDVPSAAVRPADPVPRQPEETAVKVSTLGPDGPRALLQRLRDLRSAHTVVLDQVDAATPAAPGPPDRAPGLSPARTPPRSPSGLEGDDHGIRQSRSEELLDLVGVVTKAVLKANRALPADRRAQSEHEPPQIRHMSNIVSARHLAAQHLLPTVHECDASAAPDSAISGDSHHATPRSSGSIGGRGGDRATTVRSHVAAAEGSVGFVDPLEALRLLYDRAAAATDARHGEASVATLGDLVQGDRQNLELVCGAGLVGDVARALHGIDSRTVSWTAIVELVQGRPPDAHPPTSLRREAAIESGTEPTSDHNTKDLAVLESLDFSNGRLHELAARYRKRH